eukprot:Ihof_evm1s494 gene=Ihof_evmTU1s494
MANPVLPRIVSLAEGCSERSTKIAAGELLHSIILYMIGCGTQQTGEKESELYPLYHKVIPSVLRLACDLDHVTQQLFSSLALQLVHWFSNPVKVQSHETKSLVEAIMEGLGDSVNGALREFCSQCMREFILWTIRQTNSKEQAQQAINVKSVLKKLYSMILHANAFQRMGGCMALNESYKVIGSESSLVDKCVFELFVNVFGCLRLADKDDPSLGTIDQAKAALKHVVDIIKRHRAMLLIASPNRRKPIGWERDPNLTALVEWCMQQTGCIEREARRQAMNTVSVLAPLLTNKGSDTVWIQSQSKDSDPEYFVRICERNGWLMAPNQRNADNEKIVVWYRQMEASLELYDWLMKKSYCTPEDLFKPEAHSNLLDALTIFINDHSLLGTFTDLVIHTALSPSMSGCDFANHNDSLKLKRETGRLLMVLGSTASEDIKEEMSLAVSRVITNQEGDIISPLNLIRLINKGSSVDIMRVTTLVSGYEIFYAAGFVKSLGVTSEEFVQVVVDMDCSNSIAVSDAVNPSPNKLRDHDTTIRLMIGILETVLVDPELNTYKARFVQSFLQGFKGQHSDWWEHESIYNRKQDTLILLAKLVKADEADNWLNPATNPAIGGMVSQLKHSLDTLIDLHYPMIFSELTPGSVQYKDCLKALDCILHALTISRNVILLSLLIGLRCREVTHPRDDAIQISLNQYAEGLEEEEGVMALATCMGFITDHSYRHDIRWNVCNYFAVPIMMRISTNILERFFVNNIVAMVTRISGPNQFAAEKVYRSQLVSKACGYCMIGCLYQRLPYSALHTVEGLVVRAFLAPKPPTTGKELSMAIIKAAHKIRGERALLDDTVTNELWRQLNCMAYNALSAVILLTQSKPDTISGFLFKENTKKGELLWNNIININDIPVFPVDLATANRRVQWKQIKSDLSVNTNRTTTPYYLPSQMVLSQAVTQDQSLLDIGATQATQGTNEVPLIPDNKVLDGNTLEELEEDTIEIDSVNKHETMLTILRTIDIMNTTLCKPPEDNVNITSNDMPKWMAELLATINSPDAALAAQIYIAKIILNRPSIFRPYATFWLAPLIILARKYGETVQNGINYFIVDICALLLSWSDVAMPQPMDGKDCTSLLCFLMQNSYHDITAVLSHNVLVIKTMVETWTEFLDVPTHIIYQLLTPSNDNTSKLAIIGIQLLGVMVANDIPLFNLTEESDRPGLTYEMFIKALLVHLGNKYKDVYKQTAEVLGMMFKQQYHDVDHSQDTIYSHVIGALRRFVDTHQYDRFVTCVYYMHLHYPIIVDLFVSQLFFLIPALYGEYRAMIYEVLTTRANHIDNMFIHLKPHLLGIIKNRETRIQRCALSTLQSLLSQLDTPQIEYFLPTLLETAATIDDLKCSQLSFGILEWLYDHGNQSPRTPLSSSLQQGVLNQLLGYLCHRSSVLRDQAALFWNQEARLSHGFTERLSQLLQRMYTPANEDYYLNYATGLLLDLCEKSIDFNTPLWDKPLSACKFKIYNIQTQWDRGVIPMTPMIGNTQASMLQSQYAIASSAIDLANGHLRSTQMSLPFSQTASSLGNGSMYGNTMYGNTMYGNTISFTPTEIMRSESGGGSSLFHKRVRSRYTERMASNSQLNTVSSSGVDQSQDLRKLEFSRLRRRIIQGDGQAASTFHAKRQARKNRDIENMRLMQKRARDNQVTLYRAYRIGELPDIQIKHRDILVPLKTVCQKDGNLARQLLAAFFRPSTSDLSQEESGYTPENTSIIETSIKTILVQSTQLCPPFIGCMLQICYDNNEITLPPEIVADISIRSYNHQLGIIILEKQICNSPIKERNSKRQRSHIHYSINNDEPMVWMELSRIYRSLGEYDVLRGISTNSLLGSGVDKAIEYESRGGYEEAVKVYGLLLTEGGVLYKENVMEGLLKCLQNTLDWAVLAGNIGQWNYDMSLFDDCGTVWDHSNKEILVETLLRAPFYSDKKTPTTDNCQISNMSIDSITEVADRFVDKSTGPTSQHKAYLETKFPQQLAYIYMARKDYDRSRYYISRAYSTFLSDWTSYHPLMFTNRQARLQQLQSLVEMDECLTVLTNKNNDMDLDVWNDLQRQWVTRRANRKQDKALIWDDIYEGRKMCVAQIIDRCKTHKDWRDNTDPDSDDGNMTQGLVTAELLFSSAISAAAASRKQGNFRAAKNLLKQAIGYVSHISLPTTNHMRLIQTHQLSLLNCAQIAANRPTTRNTSRLVLVLHELINNDRYLSPEHVEDNVRHCLIKGQTSMQLGQSFASMTSCDLNVLWMDKAIGTRMEGIGLLVDAAPATLYKICMETTYRSLQDGVKASRNTLSLQGKVLIRLIEFCDHILRQTVIGSAGSEMKSLDGERVQDTFPSYLVSSIIKCMALGHRKANGWFPRVLQLVEEYPDTGPLLEKEAINVPCWMFIGWISQIGALLANNTGDHVGNILLSVAKQYPDCLFYPMNVNKNQLETKGHSKYLPQIQAALYSPIRSRFILEIERLAYPEHGFNDWLDNDFKPAARAKDQSGLKAAYKKLTDFLLIPKSNERIYRNFYNAYAKSLLAITGKDGLELVNARADAFDSLMATMNDKLRINPGGVEVVKDFSIWLANYQASDYPDTPIEIPGQYTGTSQPIPEQHAKLVSVDDWMIVLNSIRKPKRIRLRGNDEKDYAFLVKGREDLRLDQRIEQIFTIMNSVLQEDAAAYQRQLYLRTYKVIPLTTRVGIIQWMVGIGDRHLSNFMFDTLTGRLIGIDFGHAFGSATILLPVPELVPFRLTNQIANIMHPLATNGLLRNTMAVAMQAVQDNSDMLLRVMNVFVTEPILEWETEAKKTAQTQGGTIDSSWFPLEKLAIVQEKLNRANPVTITCNELETGAKTNMQKKMILPTLKTIVEGDKQRNIRAQVPAQCVSVEQQVDCLIDLATDPNILGRCWH